MEMQTLHVDEKNKRSSTLRSDVTQEHKLPAWKHRIQMIVDHPVVVALVLLMILTDVSIAISIFCNSRYDIGDSNAIDSIAVPFNIVTIVIVSSLLFEILLRVAAAATLKVYFFNFWNDFEFCVVVVSFVLVVIGSRFSISPLRALRLVARLLRYVRFIIKMKQTYESSKKAARHQVGMNKKRYQRDGFDLDLCYITDRIIAMSVPAIKKEGFYRNPLSEVVRFFNTKYQSKYRIFNLCSEREYPTDKFLGKVERWPFEDHSVPALETMPKFTKTVIDFLNEDEENVVAIHCKGGKGRTGTMICGVLLAANIQGDAKCAQDFFAKQRTDLSKPGKLQGVETASQLRWIAYYDMALKRGFPGESFAELEEIRVTGVPRFRLENECGSHCWWTLTSVTGDDKVPVLDYNSHAKMDGVTCQIDGKDTVVWKCQNIKVRDNTVMIVQGYNDKDAIIDYFFFWFHAAFIENGTFSLRKREFDKCKGSSGKAAYKSLASNANIVLRFKQNTVKPNNGDDDDEDDEIPPPPPALLSPQSPTDAGVMSPTETAALLPHTASNNNAAMSPTADDNINEASSSSAAAAANSDIRLDMNMDVEEEEEDDDDDDEYFYDD